MGSVSKRRQQAALRKQFNLPKRCECGGEMEYDYEFGRVWSGCRRCTPVVVIKLPRRAPTPEPAR